MTLAKKIEPMDAEIPKNEIVDRFERRPGDPAVVPADLDMNAGDLADEAGADRFPDVGEMRRPAAVLIDRELQFAPRRQFDEFAPVVEVLDERLLRQDVLSRIQRAAHEVDAHVRVGRDVENPQARVAEQGLEIVGDARLREIRVAPRLGALKIARADRHDVEPMARVSVEMRAADAARADESDRRASVARHWRTIGQVRRVASPRPALATSA